MTAKLVPVIVVLAAATGCAGLHHGIQIDRLGEMPVINPGELAIELGDVTVGEGGLFRPAIWWEPSFWTLVPLPSEKFRHGVQRVVADELADSGYAKEGPADYILHVTIEELGLTTRGDVREGFRAATALLRCELRAGEASIYEAEAEGESRYTGSRVRRSKGSSVLRPLYVYETAEPDPMANAVRKAMRRFLRRLPQGALHEARTVPPAGE